MELKRDIQFAEASIACSDLSDAKQAIERIIDDVGQLERRKYRKQLIFLLNIVVEAYLAAARG